MATKKLLAQKGNSPYSAAMTRDQFMFYEMRITARLVEEGLDEQQIINKICVDNSFQYPTEKSTQRMTRSCLRRLACLGDETLVAAIANDSSDVAKQICLYAMMKQYRLVWDFMVTVIGEKYRSFDMTFTKMDMNAFFMRLQEQDDWVASWSDSTISKLKQVLYKLLVDNEYLESTQSEILKPVLICSVLENAIRDSGDECALIAFNCFS